MRKRNHVIIKRKRRSVIYKFVLDATANYIFFVPLFVALNTVTFFFGLPYWSVENILTYVGTSFIGSFLLGGVYGRVLNIWRKKLNYH